MIEAVRQCFGRQNDYFSWNDDVHPLHLIFNFNFTFPVMCSFNFLSRWKWIRHGIMFTEDLLDLDSFLDFDEPNEPLMSTTASSYKHIKKLLQEKNALLTEELPVPMTSVAAAIIPIDTAVGHENETFTVDVDEPMKGKATPPPRSKRTRDPQITSEIDLHDKPVLVKFIQDELLCKDYLVFVCNNDTCSCTGFQNGRQPVCYDRLSGNFFHASENPVMFKVNITAAQTHPCLELDVAKSVFASLKKIVPKPSRKKQRIS